MKRNLSIIGAFILFNSFFIGDEIASSKLAAKERQYLKTIDCTMIGEEVDNLLARNGVEIESKQCVMTDTKGDEMSYTYHVLRSYILTKFGNIVLVTQRGFCRCPDFFPQGKPLQHMTHIRSMAAGNGMILLFALIWRPKPIV